MNRSALIVAVALLLAVAPGYAGNFADDFAKASDLLKGGKYAEAQKMFLGLADAAPTPASADEALRQAAMAADRQKNFEEALEIAGRIKNGPLSKLCCMRIQNNNQKYTRTLQEFRSEDLGAWPDEIASQGYFLRGFAALVAKDRAGAVEDLQKAVDRALTPEDRVTAAEVLGTCYMGQPGDEDKALAAYAIAEQYPKLNGAAAYLRSVVNASVILTQRGKLTEAVDKLDLIQQKGLTGYWKAVVVAAYADVDLAKGNKKQATEKYKEALAVDGIPESLTREIQGKLDAAK